MAKQRKQILVNGQKYEPIPKDKARRYRNVDNHKEIKSRRQIEKAELQTQGYKSFESKAKTRKSQGIPKGFKQTKKWGRNTDTKKFYAKRLGTITELREELERVPDETIVSIVFHYQKNYPNLKRQTGESLKNFNARKHLKLQQTVTPNATPEWVLTHKDFAKIKQRFINQGYVVNEYEIRFTFIPAK